MSEKFIQDVLLDVPTSTSCAKISVLEAPPRFRRIDRNQLLLRTVDVEQLVAPDHSVRAIWSLSERIDWTMYTEEVQAVEGGSGRPAWDPRLLACIWIHAYTRGIGSAREISRRLAYDPAFQWLAGMEQINYHTLADFRTKTENVEQLFIKLLGVLSAEGLITLERVTHDGTKIRACASGKSFRREKRIQEHLEVAREHVAAMDNPLAEETARKRAARRAAANRRLKQLEAATEVLAGLIAEKSLDKKQPRVSETDPDARIMKQGDGGYAPSYNVQLSEDAKHDIIVGVGVSQSYNDYSELIPAVERVKTGTGQLPSEWVSDGGFTCRENILAMETIGVEFFGSLGDHSSKTPAQMRRRGVSEAYYPQAFAYDAASNTYRCPAGQVLVYEGKENRSGIVRQSYRAKIETCSVCPHQAQCCPGNIAKGRRISRMVEDPCVAAFREKMQTENAKQVYRTRSPLAEFPNAWIKVKIGLRQFCVRGLPKVTAEAFWAAVTYNIQQWIRLCWRPALKA